MKPLVDTNGAAAVSFWLVFGGWGVLEWLPGLKEIVARRRLADRSIDEGTARHLFVFASLGYGAAFVAAFNATGLAIGGPRAAIFVTGLVVLVGGVGFRQWAIHTLGLYFSRWLDFQQGQVVVSGGPYRVVRHPSYLGGLIGFLGLGLALGNWLAVLAAVAFPLVGYVRRIDVEEAMLHARLGAAYDDYALGRARLIPGVW